MHYKMGLFLNSEINNEKNQSEMRVLKKGPFINEEKDKNRNKHMETNIL